MPSRRGRHDDSVGKRPKEAVPFLEFAIRHGDAQAKENAAALLYQGGASLLQQPQDSGRCGGAAAGRQ